MTVIIGIDPGATGYICAIRGAEKIDFRRIPHFKQVVGRTNRSFVDIRKMVKLLKSVHQSGSDIFAMVERQQPFQRDGKSACFIMGRNYGTLLNALDITDTAYDVVSPVTWKKHFGLSKRGTETEDQMKQRAADLAVQFYPALADDIRADKDFGLAECLLIGRYGGIKHGLGQ